MYILECLLLPFLEFVIIVLFLTYSDSDKISNILQATLQNTVSM